MAVAVVGAVTVLPVTVLPATVLPATVLPATGGHRLVPFGAVTRAGCWAM